MESMVWVWCSEGVVLRSSSGSGMGVPSRVTISRASLISIGIGLRSFVSIHAWVRQWCSWGKWLSPCVTLKVQKLQVKGMVWIWCIESSGLGSSSGSGVSVPGRVTSGRASLIGSGISLRSLVSIDAWVGQWCSWKKWLIPWFSFLLGKTTMNGLGLPCWFTSACFTWNLVLKLWVGIALVGDWSNSSLCLNSSLGSSTIVDSGIIWTTDLGKTTMDGLSLPCWFTSACLTWKLILEFWVRIAWVRYTRSSSFSHNRRLRFSSIVNTIRSSCFWISFNLGKTSVNGLSLPCGLTSACLSRKLILEFWIGIARIGNRGNSSFSGDCSLGFCSIVYSIKLNWISCKLGKTSMDSLSLPCWFSSASLTWKLVFELWIGVAFVGHTLNSSFCGNSSLGFSSVVDTVRYWISSNLSKGSCRSAIGVCNTHSFSRRIAYW